MRPSAILSSFLSFALIGGLPGAVFAEGAKSDALEDVLFQEMPPVNITALKSESLTKASGIVSVITADDIKRMGARTLMDVLDQVPGWETNINRQGEMSVSVRGVGSDRTPQVLFMINGVRMNDAQSGTGFVAHGDYSLDEVDRIEIIRGPGSAIYGENALVGVINIITRTASTFSGAKASARYGGFNRIGGSAQYGTQAGPVSLYVFADGEKSGGYDGKIKRDRYFGSPFDESPGKASRKVENFQGSLDLSVGGLEVQYRRLINNHGQFAGATGTLVTEDKLGDRWIGTDYHLGSVKYVAKMGDFTLIPSANLFLLHSENSFVLYPPGWHAGPNPVFPDGMQGTPIYDNRRLSGNLLGEYGGFKKWDILGGVSYDNIAQYGVQHHTNFNPLIAPAPLAGGFQDVSDWANWQRDVRRYILGIYAQAKVDLRDDLSATLGGRYDKYNDVGETKNPRASLVWSPTDRLDVKFLYGSAFRAPNFRELYNVPATNPTFKGNPNLKPETINTYESGAYYRIGDRGSLTGVNIFYNDVRRLIDLNSALTTYNSVNRAYVGEEWENKLAVLQNVKVSATYSHLDGHYKGGGSIPYLLRHKVTAGVDYQPVKGLTLHADSFYLSARNRANPDPNPGNLPPRSRVPDYAVVNANVLYEAGRLDLSFSVHNLFNNTSYVSPDPLGYVSYDYPLSGRDMVVKAGYKF